MKSRKEKEEEWTATGLSKALDGQTKGIYIDCESSAIVGYKKGSGFIERVVDINGNASDLNEQEGVYALTRDYRGWLFGEPLGPSSDDEDEAHSLQAEHLAKQKEFQEKGTNISEDWKFHISIKLSQEDSSTYDKAFSIILPILARNKVFFKCIDPIKQKNKLASEASADPALAHNQGMEFTIYGTERQNPQQLVKVMAEIEAELKEAGISPQVKHGQDGAKETLFPTVCRALSESEFISYRNEKRYFQDQESGDVSAKYVDRPGAYLVALSYMGSCLRGKTEPHSNTMMDAIGKLVDDEALSKKIVGSQPLNNSEWDKVRALLEGTQQGEDIVRKVGYFLAASVDFQDGMNIPIVDPIEGKKESYIVTLAKAVKELKEQRPKGTVLEKNQQWDVAALQALRSELSTGKKRAAEDKKEGVKQPKVDASESPPSTIYRSNKGGMLFGGGGRQGDTSSNDKKRSKRRSNGPK